MSNKTTENQVCPRCQNVWANCPTWGRCLKPTDDCLQQLRAALEWFIRRGEDSHNVARDALRAADETSSG